jgi:2-C-methyl-D-erythritol 4-phosphate cytidylyltransferase
VVPKGGKATVLLAETVQMAAVVEAVDAKTRKLTLKVAGGRTRVLRVDNGLKHLDGLKKGDAVVIRMIEAIAIKVEKRK